MTSKLLRLGMPLLFAAASLTASAQRIALKTNTFDWALMSPNLTLETRLSNRVTLDFGIAGSPFKHTPYGSDIMLRNFRLMPEVRYWFNRPMARHYAGIAMTGGTFDLGWNHRRYRGNMFAAGLTYGYALVLGKHWNVEFSIGLGLGKAWGYKFKDSEQQPDDTNLHKWIPVPMNTGISFSYIFK